MGSHETSWADQWDDGPDPINGSNQSKKKSNNVLGKTKTVASTGVKKLKEGTLLASNGSRPSITKPPTNIKSYLFLFNSLYMLVIFSPLFSIHLFLMCEML
uniref:UVI1 n=1 Tax=Pisum sativum TaxID=3888 RepID=Q9AUH7_PEA|nr:UVI1 [Pisum sativum]